MAKNIMTLTFGDLMAYDGRPPGGGLPRKGNVNVALGQYRAKLRAKGLTLDQEIMRLITERHRDEKYVIVVNLFPYDVADDIGHLVVWMNPMLVGEPDEAEVRRYVADGLNGGPFVLYENLPGNRTVPGVRHFQLFVRKRDLMEAKWPIYKLT
jgi:Protein of unknown function (DUF3605)